MTAFLIVKAGQNIKKFRTVIVICIIAGFAPALLVYVLSSNMSALIVALISVVMTFVAYPGYKIYVALTGWRGGFWRILLMDKEDGASEI